MTDKTLQKIVKESRDTWGFGYEDLLLLLCGLTTEVGELNDCIRDQYIYKKPPIPEEDKSSLKHELADVLIYLYSIADECNIDLYEAVLSKVELNNKRFRK